MTNMLFGIMGNAGIPADEKVVRTTATPVIDDKPAAMQEDVPEFNDKLESDEDPNLGIVNRTLASHWVEGQQSAPFWIDTQAEQNASNQMINQQVSTAGTAAAREKAGEFGHGTLSYAVGIEPVQGLTEGGRFGNDYFATGKPNIQETMGDYMSVPPGYDGSTTAQVMATGKDAARQATGVYDAYYKSMQGR